MLDALETARQALSMNTPQGDADCLATADDILQLQPDNSHAMYLAGTSLLRMKQAGLATLILNAASQLNPGEPAIWNNLGCALREWHPKDAVAVFSMALEKDPDHVEAKKNLAACLGRIGRRDEAIELNQQIREVRPDDADVPYNLALDLLHTPDWTAAFEAYEYSEGNKHRKVRNYHQDKQTPRWDGTDNGDTVVIYGEQGVGDEVLASVALQAAIAQNPSCVFIVDCDPRLEKLFLRSFPDAIIYGTRDKDELAWPEVEKPDSSLIAMANFGQLIHSSAEAAPWLEPDAALVEMFTKYLARLGDGPKIGLSWSGGATDWDRDERTIPIEQLGPIMAIPNATIINLEYQDGPKPEGVHDISWATHKGVDLDVTAALVAALDMVVSVPQTICDIAGAVGTPLKAMVGPNPPWRFAEAAGDAWVWSDVKTYRKKPEGNWMPVVARVARDIREGL